MKILMREDKEKKWELVESNAYTAEIVAHFETERAIVHGNRGLIRLDEEKGKKVIDRVREG